MTKKKPPAEHRRHERKETRVIKPDATPERAATNDEGFVGVVGSFVAGKQ